MFGWLLTKVIYIAFQPDLHGIRHHLFHLLKRKKKVFICLHHLSLENTYPSVIINLLLNILLNIDNVHNTH